MNRKILALAIPSIVANITTPLLGLVDTAIVGHMGSAVFIASIAVGGSVFNLLYWCFAFLRMGSSGMTAQANGAGDKGAESLVLYRSVLVALIAGLIMIAFSEPVAKGMLWFMDVDESTGLMVMEYVTIAIWGAPAVLSVYSLSGWFLGMQNSRASMWISIVINVSNIAVSLSLVYLFKWEIAGVATGTMVAQWIGFVWGVVVLWHRYRPLSPGWRLIVDFEGLRRFFSINFDIFLRTLCLVAVTLWFTRSGAAQGTLILAVNALLMQMFMLFSYMMDGFAFAGEALAGHYLGGGDDRNLRKCVKFLLGWGAALSAVFTSLYFVMGDELLGLLSSQPEVIEKSLEYLPWAATIPLAGFAAFTWDGVFIGATRTREMLFSMVIAVGVFFAIYFCLFPSLGNDALWMAFISYLFIRGAVQTWLARSLLV